MQRTRRLLRFAAIALLIVVPACGKKGPPLPPLVKLPVPPDGFTAVRRGDTVQLQFTVPATNTDRTRPANVERVDIYALTGDAPASDADLLKRSSKVASVAVKAPRDPNQTTDVDALPEEAEEIEPPEGAGLDQGAAARVEERLTTAALAATVPSRTYIGVGVNKSGRQGPPSRRVAVPLAPAPAAPAAVRVSYDEHVVTVVWSPPVLAEAAPVMAYNVYEVVRGAAGAGALPAETQLTKTPAGDPRFADPRISWGATRCYVVRTLERVGTLALESDGTPPECVTFADTFPPGAPKGLTAVASEGAISLIWESNDEADLDGYLVLRGSAPGGALAPVTPSVIRETTFRDVVPVGAHYSYAIEAVDKAGNVGPPSAPVDETAR